MLKKRMIPLVLLLAILLCIPVHGIDGALSADNVSAHAGEQVQIDVKLQNPGIVGTRIFVRYDGNLLRLDKAENGVVFDAQHATFGDDVTNNPYILLWEDSLRPEDITQSGTLCLLTFTILSDAAPQDAVVQIDVDENSTFNTTLTRVPVAGTKCTVTILEDDTPTVDPTLRVKSLPARMEYVVGDAFDPTGLVLIYTDKTGAASEITEGFDYAPYDLILEGTQTISVIYKGLTVTFDVQVTEKSLEPAVAIRRFTESRTVDYRTTITFSADVQNPVAGAEVRWFINGEKKDAGEKYTVKEAKKSFTVQAKYIQGETVLAESETETVLVKDDFFSKVIAFFRGLFRRLPEIAQTYLGVGSRVDL